MFKTLRILALAPILAVASLAYVSAPAAAADLPFYSSGLVDQNGNVDVGTGFTVQHTGAGTYVITYPTGTFTSFPLMTVTPFGFDGHSTTAIIAWPPPPTRAMTRVDQAHHPTGPAHVEAGQRLAEPGGPLSFPRSGEGTVAKPIYQEAPDVAHWVDT